MADVDRQIGRMDEIFNILKKEKHIEISKGMIGMIKDAFTLKFRICSTY
jgi:hypothetical protein